jgi:hypothetical protein
MWCGGAVRRLEIGSNANVNDLALCLKMLKVGTLQNGCLGFVAKRFERILEAADGGGNEQIVVIHARHQLFKIAVIAIARGVTGAGQDAQLFTSIQ